MSFLVGAVTMQSFKLGQGMAPRALAIADHTKLIKAPACVTVPINWADYGGGVGQSILIEVDLSILGASNPIDQLRSMSIDNSFSDQDVFVFFPDTGFTLICPANSIMMGPVWTNGLKAQVYASGFLNFTVPSTTFQFSNIPKDVPNVITAASIIVKSLYTSNSQNISTGTQAATKTFNAVYGGIFSPFGTQYYMVGGRANVGVPPIVNSITINGVAGILMVRTVAGAPTDSCSAIFRGPQNRGGQSDTVIITFNTPATDAFVRCVAAYNLSQPTVIFNSSVAVIPPAATLLTGAGVAMACGHKVGGGLINLTGISNVQSVSLSNLAVTEGMQQTNGAPLPVSSSSATTGASMVSLT